MKKDKSLPIIILFLIIFALPTWNLMLDDTRNRLANSTAYATIIDVNNGIINNKCKISYMYDNTMYFKTVKIPKNSEFSKVGSQFNIRVISENPKQIILPTDKSPTIFHRGFILLYLTVFVCVVFMKFKIPI